MRSPNSAGNALCSAGAAAAGGLGLQKRQKKQVPQFAVFFSDGAGFGIEMVQALDAAHAQDIAKAQHPSGRLSAVPAELSVPLGAGEMTDA